MPVLCLDGTWDAVAISNGSRRARAFPTLAGVGAVSVGPCTIRVGSIRLDGRGAANLGPVKLLAGAATVGALAGSASLIANVA